MSLIILTILGVSLSALVALVALLKNPGSTLHRWLFAFIASACFWVTAVNLHGIFVTDIAVLLLRLSFVSVAVASFCMLQFVRSIAMRANESRPRMGDYLALLTALVLGMSPYNIASVTPEGSTGYLIADRGAAYPVVIGLTLFLIGKAFVILLKQRRATRGRVRSQLTFIFSGLLLGTIIGVTSNVILPNLIRNTFPSRFAFLAVVLWTSVLMYAIVKHRFLDVRLTVIRAVGYVSALVTVAIVYVTLVIVIGRTFLVPLEGVTAAFYVSSIILAVITALTFHPLRLFFDRVTTRFFFRNAYNSQDIINKLSDTFTQTVELSQLAGSSLHLLHSTLKPDFIWVGIIGTSGKLEYERNVGKRSVDAGKLQELFDKIPNGPLVIADEMEIEKPSLARAMADLNVAMITRLETSSDLVGFLFFGYKSSGSIFSSQDIGLIRVATDGLAISAQNALRFQEIRHFNETLQQRIEEATKELRATNSQLQKLDEAKDEFVSMASHQLRTPLTSVKGYISMVLEGDAGKLTAMQRQLLEEAFTSSERMVHLINDFLNVSRLQTGKFMLERRKVNLAKVVVQEVESLQATARMHDLGLRYEQAEKIPELYIDESKIRQVMMNFIDNAIYYSREGTIISVNISVAKNELVFEVHDTGIGVPKAEQAQLFTKFFRASNARKQRPDGTGVGLFLAKRIVVAHGGTIIFSSVEGKGSVFGFRLPIESLSTATGSNTDKLNHKPDNN